jgi:hypothetical protein
MTSVSCSFSLSAPTSVYRSKRRVRGERERERERERENWQDMEAYFGGGQRVGEHLARVREELGHVQDLQRLDVLQRELQ